MESDTIALISAIASVVSAVIAITSAIMAYRFKRVDGKAELDKELDRILEIGIQYPYVENRDFIADWLNKRYTDDEKYLRYDLYCNLIFNFLHHAFEFFDKDKKKVEDFVDVKTWVRAHKLNWQYPVDDNENIDGYDESFRKFINSYIQQ